MVFDETNSGVAVDELIEKLTTGTQSDGVVEDAALVVSLFFMYKELNFVQADMSFHFW